MSKQNTDELTETVNTDYLILPRSWNPKTKKYMYFFVRCADVKTVSEGNPPFLKEFPPEIHTHLVLETADKNTYSVGTTYEFVEFIQEFYSYAPAPESEEEEEEEEEDEISESEYIDANGDVVILPPGYDEEGEDEEDEAL